MAIEPITEFGIECDGGCGNVDIVAATEYAGEPPTYGVEPDDITAMGWAMWYGGATYCPTCLIDAEIEDRVHGLQLYT